MYEHSAPDRFRCALTIALVFFGKILGYIILR